MVKKAPMQNTEKSPNDAHNVTPRYNLGGRVVVPNVKVSNSAIKIFEKPLSVDEIKKMIDMHKKKSAG